MFQTTRLDAFKKYIVCVHAHTILTFSELIESFFRECRCINNNNNNNNNKKNKQNVAYI